MKKEIFKPFIKLKNDTNQPGWGLGLALSKAIVEQHNATIEVEHKEGGGSTFCIYFPQLSSELKAAV